MLLVLLVLLEQMEGTLDAFPYYGSEGAINVPTRSLSLSMSKFTYAVERSYRYEHDRQATGTRGTKVREIK